MINAFIFLFGIAIIIVGFATFDRFTLARTFSKTRKCYLLRKRKDELVFLAVENKIAVDDQLFKDMFQFLESFESVCDHLSLKHLLEDLNHRKVNPMDARNFDEFKKRIEKSDKEVQQIVLASLQETALMVISNSATVRFLFYVLKVALFKKMPNWLKRKIKSYFGPLWDTTRGIIAIDKTFGLRTVRI